MLWNKLKLSSKTGDGFFVTEQIMEGAEGVLPRILYIGTSPLK
jgi:hypothetical protein